MRRRFLPLAALGVISSLALLLAFLPGVALAQSDTHPVNVHVVQSDGTTGLAGVAITYNCGSYELTFGTTDADGHAGPVELPVGASCDFTANYQGTSATKSLTVDDHNNVDFQTSAVTVSLTDHNGGGLAGGDVAYGSGANTYWLNGTYQASYTDASGQVTGQMFDGTYDFRMQYNTGTEWQHSVVIHGATTVPFQTGQLILVYSNPISFGAGSPTVAWFTNAGTELLPGTYLFQPKGSGCTSVSIDAPAAGTSATKSIFAARLLDHTGAPLAGGVVRYAPGGSWYAMGTTDASGSICQVVDGALGNVKVGMTYHQAEGQKTQNVATNSVFTFQTALGTIQLVDHAGNGLAGGVVDQGGGFWNNAIATTDGNGYAYVELLSGHAYTFRMDYNHLSQIKTGDPTASPLVFQTGQLVLHYSGDVAGSLGGSWVTFTKPSMELFAGTYNFRFDGMYLPMTVTTGAVNEQSVITAKLTNHYGQATTGGVAQYAPGGSWINMPNTNTGGWTGVAVPGTLGNVKVRMTYHQGSQDITQYQPTASFYAFHTSQGTIRLIDHNGNGLASGVVDQGGSYWDNGIATTNASGYAYVELFSGQTYKFQMNYNHSSEILYGDPTASTMVFQTGAVYSGSGTATQWAGGAWYPFVQNMEVLPGPYHFTFSDGTSVTYYTISAGTVNLIH